MARVRVLLAAEADIEQALAFTLKRFGARKLADYGSLILEALDAIGADHHAGKERPDIAPGAWTYHIAQTGRRARHLIMYRMPGPDLVEVLALAYDGMNLPRLWRSREGER
jgi:plasmid stabilization system protein ParE